MCGDDANACIDRGSDYFRDRSSVASQPGGRRPGLLGLRGAFVEMTRIPVWVWYVAAGLLVIYHVRCDRCQQVRRQILGI